ncbi:pectinesterase [Lewinella marina]|uniref:Esterase n=1 Tax=Neolewinella marina TaxID=438751 RepID=A0A2G0CIP9_9BACT|nr:alpha/beta hydrolase [Neolewinella marina]NJB84987.1 pectinesterase [Neolewinella marina]PHK99863.1 esterase [Neolewinella marina]
MKISLFLPLLLAGGLYAQSGYQPRDTSYSIHSSYEKIRRSHPEVKPVYPRLPVGVGADTNVVYARVGEDRPLHLDVFRKTAIGPRPGVLMIHGGGWTTGSKENLTAMAQHLAERGYVTVVPEYRLSAEAPYPAGVEDLKRAVRWMRAHATEYGIDTSRIAAYGCSAGAHLASLLGTTYNLDLYDGAQPPAAPSAAVQAVVNVDGIVSFVHPAAEPEWTGRSATAWLGDYTKNYERWREASPLEYADEHTPPFLFINSSYPRFHAGRDDLFAVLDRHGIYHEEHTFADTPHAFWLLDPWFAPTLELTVYFLRRVFP